MGFFTSKKEIKLEDFCRDFYDNQILNPIIGGIKLDANREYAEVVKKNIVEVYSDFTSLDLEKLKKELIILRFEMFALAWTHKFVSGKFVVAQSAFTKRYLYENGRVDIWISMKPYNDIIDGGTLDWLKNLGKINLSFNYNMRKDLTTKNIEDAKELGIDIDESVERVNNRLWSEPAWKQKLLLGGLVYILWNQLGLSSSEGNQEVGFRLAAVIKGFYDGAQQSWDRVKIIN